MVRNPQIQKRLKATDQMRIRLLSSAEGYNQTQSVRDQARGYSLRLLPDQYIARDVMRISSKTNTSENHDVMVLCIYIPLVYLYLISISNSCP